MKHPLRILAVTLALAMTSGASIAYAQQQMTFDATFAFRLGNQVHQAGQYSVTVNADQEILSFAPVKGTANAVLVQTRLAEPESPLSGGHIVFDKVGDLYYLSEVWIPGYDGFLLHSTKDKHIHAKVKLAKKG